MTISDTLVWFLIFHITLLFRWISVTHCIFLSFFFSVSNCSMWDVNRCKEARKNSHSHRCRQIVKTCVWFVEESNTVIRTPHPTFLSLMSDSTLGFPLWKLSVNAWLNPRVYTKLSTALDYVSILNIRMSVSSIKSQSVKWNAC